MLGLCYLVLVVVVIVIVITNSACDAIRHGYNAAALQNTYYNIEIIENEKKNEEEENLEQNLRVHK